MDIIPLVDKRNFKKILRELDVKKYPSLSDYLVDWHYKLNDKIKKKLITPGDEILIYNRLFKYFSDYRKELNKSYVNSINWEKVNHRPPKEFQKVGIKYLLLNSRCILADDMGIGKTIQSVLASLFLPDEYKILIITTNTLKYNFKVEIEYYDDRISVIKDVKKWEVKKFTIIHYSQVGKLHDKIIEEGFDVVICDEAHFVKNPQSQRSQTVVRLFEKMKKEIKYVWLLTGTPITNRPIEYFNLLRIIKHPLAKNYFEFIHKYCNAYQDMWGHWVTDGASNTEDLYDKTKGSILRRKKKDVLDELPSKERIPIFFEMKNRKGYEKCVSEYEKKKQEEFDDEFKDLPFAYKVPSIAEMMIKRLFCAREKIHDGTLINIIKDDIEDDNKIVVFTNFTSVLDEIKNKFKDICLIIDGRTKVEDRIPLCVKFNTDDKIKIVGVNIAVGAEGLNLQSANLAIINDMHLVPGKMIQVEDRLHRMGQLKDVVIKYPIYNDSVEVDLYEMITRKMRIVSEVTDGVKEDYFEKNDEIEKFTNNNSILNDIFKQIDSIRT